jgi:hypothetical protein
MRDASVLQHPCIEPFANQSKQHSVSYPTLQKGPEMAMVDRIKRLSNMMPPSRTHLSSIPK